MKAYVYHLLSSEIVVIICGTCHKEIVENFEQQNWDEDYYGLSFSDTGLVETSFTSYIEDK